MSTTTGKPRAMAMGTSLPEAAVSLVAGLKGNSGITIGNVVGSNILNILIVLGMSALITKIVADTVIKPIGAVTT